MGPALLVVKVGSTRVRVASATSTASVGLVPSTRKASTRWRRPPTPTHSPTTPLQTIMIAANTVSRASALAVAPPASISATISATSITVTVTATAAATASISVPKGSPTLCATTSAWCTAVTAAATRQAPMPAKTSPPGSVPKNTASTPSDSTGSHRLHRRKALGRRRGMAHAQANDPGRRVGRSCASAIG